MLLDSDKIYFTTLKSAFYNNKNKDIMKNGAPIQDQTNAGACEAATPSPTFEGSLLRVIRIFVKKVPNG